MFSEMITLLQLEVKEVLPCSFSLPFLRATEIMSLISNVKVRLSDRTFKDLHISSPGDLNNP